MYSFKAFRSASLPAVQASIGPASSCGVSQHKRRLKIDASGWARDEGARSVIAHVDSRAGAATAGAHAPAATPAASPPATETMAHDISTADKDIDSRIALIDSVQELDRELAAAGDRLVVLEVMKEAVCETGLLEADDGWTPDRHKREEEKLKACETIRHQFTRLASDSPDVRFLESYQMENEDLSDVCRHLGVTTFPTVIFFKSSSVVWRAHGSASLRSDMNEGMLYFSESPTLRSREHVVEITTVEDYRAFMAGDVAPEGQQESDAADVSVVMFTEPLCTPCIHVYPSVVTLAMNFKGMIDFARLEADGSTETNELFRELNILEVPTFLMFHKGVEVSRDVSSHRGDLIGHVLQTAMKLGIKPPQPKKL